MKDDNRPENLELATYSEQMIHATRVLGTSAAAKQWGEANHRAKLTEVQVIEIRRRREGGERLAAIAADYGVAFQTVSRIALRDRWTRLGSG